VTACLDWRINEYTSTLKAIYAYIRLVSVSRHWCNYNVWLFNERWKTRLHHRH